MTDDLLVCHDCTARFRDEDDARLHEEYHGHNVHRPPERHEADVRRSERLDAQAPRGRRERHLDGQGKPRADY